MPFKSLKFVPGLNSQLTPLLLETGWFLGMSYGSNSLFASNLMRFPAENSGQPQPIGGWAKLTTVAGIPRGLHGWSTLPGTITASVITPLLGIGTSTKLYAYDYTTAHDVTPVALGTNDAAWALDNFGQNLIAVRRGSPIYQWVPSVGYTAATALGGDSPPHVP